MGKVDVATRKYMEDPARFADAFNYAIYGGEHVIDSAELRPYDSVSELLPAKGGPAVERRRDGLRLWSAMSDGRAAYALLGFEGQTNVNRSMPVRGMLYDALAYQDQVDEIRRRNRKAKVLRNGDYLSGLREGDSLLPVVTLVIHFGQGLWDAPLSLHALLNCDDTKLLALVPDYKINLISPAAMGKEDFARFETELGLVLGYIRYGNDKDGLKKFVASNKRFRQVDVESAQLVNVLGGPKLKIRPGEERVEMWKAFEDIRQEGVDEGVQQGMQQGMLSAFAGLVRDGVLTVADAAARAGLTPEEFEQKAKAIARA